MNASWVLGLGGCLLSGVSNHPAGPHQVVVPKVSATRLFVFWTPAWGYSWGHTHYCHEDECPNSGQPVNVCFLAPDLCGSAIQQAGASGQGQLSETNPVPDPVHSDDDNAPILGSASSIGDTRCKGMKKRKEKEGGPCMCGKCDMSVRYVN